MERGLRESATLAERTKQEVAAAVDATCALHIDMYVHLLAALGRRVARCASCMQRGSSCAKPGCLR